MTKFILLSAALLLLAAPNASCFVPRASPGKIAAHSMPPTLYALLDHETKVSEEIDPLATGWKQQIIRVLDVNGDGRVDHKDAGAVATMACLSWSLMATPAMAKGSHSHSSSHSSSRSSSSRSSVSRSSSSRSSPSRTSSSSSSISSSSSRKSSSPYKSTATSSSSRNNRSFSPSVSKVSVSSSSIPVSSPSSAKQSSSASSSKSLSNGDRVTMVSPKSSSARLNVKSRAKSKVSPAKATNSQTASNTVQSKTSTKSSQSTTTPTPSSSIPSKKSSVSTKSKSKSSSMTVKPTTITSSEPTASSTKKKTRTSSVNALKTTTSTTQKKVSPKVRQPTTTESMSTASGAISKPTKASSSSGKKNSSIGTSKPTATTTKTTSTATKAAPKNDKIKASSQRKTKLRSGKRVGGRASKQRSTGESVEQETRDLVVIERNTYIVRPPISTPYYGGSRTIYSDYPPTTAYETQPRAYSSTNSGTAIPPKQQQTEQLPYPPYKRPNPPKCSPKQSPKSKCNCDLPYDGETIDVLVDPIQGLYVRGGVTFVDPKKCDFIVTIFSSADGQPVQKSLHAINLEQFATKNIPNAKLSENVVMKK
mmetsp:Transcript_650/g.1542  ORF Transcript_650/g.1542 Transcript_650/m.1542 type:complete len:592 (-) Transcript_650:164-1939(-)